MRRWLAKAADVLAATVYLFLVAQVRPGLTPSGPERAAQRARAAHQEDVRKLIAAFYNGSARGYAECARHHAEQAEIHATAARRLIAWCAVVSALSAGAASMLVGWWM